MKRLLIAPMLCLANQFVLAQNLVEFRLANTHYRYFDWAYTLPNQVVVDFFYIGVPGSNEFNLGSGYSFQPTPSLTLTPILYFVAAKEERQRGLKLALLVNFEKNDWQVNSFLAHFAPLKGKVPSYQVLDTLDISKTLTQRLELGISSGFFHQDDNWNPLIGPILKINDRYGAWGISSRFGDPRELRITRILLF